MVTFTCKFPNGNVINHSFNISKASFEDKEFIKTCKKAIIKQWDCEVLRVYWTSKPKLTTNVN
jgi:hypothetical protein